MLYSSSMPHQIQMSSNLGLLWINGTTMLHQSHNQTEESPSALEDTRMTYMYIWNQGQGSRNDVLYCYLIFRNKRTYVRKAKPTHPLWEGICRILLNLWITIYQCKPVVLSLNCQNTIKTSLKCWKIDTTLNIFVSKQTITGSDNGVSPGRPQAIIWTNAEILLSWNFRTGFSDTLSQSNTFSFKNMHLKMALENVFILSQPQCTKRTDAVHHGNMAK